MANHHPPTRERREQCDLSMGVLAANGYAVTEEVERLLTPLHAGEITLAQMEADLVARLKRLNHDS